MARKGFDWNRMAESYRIIEHRRSRLHQGPRTLSDRIGDELNSVRYQFLPHYFSRPPKWRLWLRSLRGPRTLPDFACVGAIKSGTSDLATYLFQHPSILAPLSKEIMTPNTREWLVHYPTRQERQRVVDATGKAVSGYFAPWMHHLPLIDAYKAARPDARIILMLRDPVERAYSHYKWDLFLGGKGQIKIAYYRTFAAYVEAALDLFPATSLPSRCGFPLLQTGIYFKSVELWMDRFGRENVYVFRSEDFFQDPARTVCGIHEFLGLPPIAPELHEAVNQNPLRPPAAEEDTRSRLREFYRPWNEKLYQLLDRDLGWK
jgi:sulfotransferase family protein